MFTVKTIHNLGRIFKLGSQTSALPFQWNSKSTRLEVGTKTQRIIMATVIIYMYVEAAYQAYRLVVGYHNKSVSLTMYMKLVELFTSRLIALLVQTYTFVYCVDAKNFVNQLLSMNARFIRKCNLFLMERIHSYHTNLNFRNPSWIQSCEGSLYQDLCILVLVEHISSNCDCCHLRDRQ